MHVSMATDAGIEDQVPDDATVADRSELSTTKAASR